MARGRDDRLTSSAEVSVSSSELGKKFYADEQELLKSGSAVIDLEEPGFDQVTSRIEDGFAVISISDTGGGIPEAIRKRIFEPFFTTKEVGRGTGQGLSIAHNVIKAHGGKLDFVTELGKGTTFNVRLPLGDADSSEAAA